MPVALLPRLTISVIDVVLLSVVAPQTVSVLVPEVAPVMEMVSELSELSVAEPFSSLRSFQDPEACRGDPRPSPAPLTRQNPVSGAGSTSSVSRISLPAARRLASANFVITPSPRHGATPPPFPTAAEGEARSPPKNCVASPNSFGGSASRSRLAKLRSSYLHRERYYRRRGVSRERKGENVFRHLPPLEAAAPENAVYL